MSKLNKAFTGLGLVGASFVFVAILAVAFAIALLIAWPVMAIVGALHGAYPAYVPALGYWWSVLVVVLARLLVTGGQASVTA